MDRIDLQSNMTVYYRDREYVLVVFREVEGPEGRSLDIQALEPIYAARNKMDKEQQRKHAEESLRLMPKMEKIADMGIDELGKED